LSISKFFRFFLPSLKYLRHTDWKISS